MKIQFLGTAAYEGIPAMFCVCEKCKTARLRGGKNLRTRSQALIDGKLLIDFPADTLAHTLIHEIDLSEIQDCILTHTHSDHLYCSDLDMIMFDGYSKTGKNIPFRFHGLKSAMLKIHSYVNTKCFGVNERIQTLPIELYQPTQVGDYNVTALKAIHDINSFPAIYLIEDKEGKVILYGNDTNYFCDEVWEYFEKNPVKISLAALDCTQGNTPFMPYVGHMNFNDNLKVKEKLIELGCADDKTIFLSNHFSHNGDDVNYDEFSEIAEKFGFLTTYDGMIVEV